MEYYVYLLTNTNKTAIYTGVTNDLIRRVYEHKHHLDKGSFTDRYNVENLVYYESTSDVYSAIERKTDQGLEPEAEGKDDRKKKSRMG